MPVPAARRRQIRQLAGAMLVSLGTAVFAGAVSLVIDATVKNGTPRWPYLIGYLAVGVILSGSGAWLLATIRVGVGLAVVATDTDGDMDRYLDEAEAFSRFGAAHFAALSTLQVPVETVDDLPVLRSRLLAGIRTLTQIEQGAAAVGVHFTGRLHVGFHIGQWLTYGARRVDLYAGIRHSDGASHLRAIRLGPSPQTSPRVLDLALNRRKGEMFNGPTPLVTGDVAAATADAAKTPMGLAVNLNGPVDDMGLISPVLASALEEGASTVVVAALPASADDPYNPARMIGASTQEYESTVTALVSVAKRMPAAPGFLYLKGPSVVSVALGRFLSYTNWIPMRYHFNDSGFYERFPANPQN
jgi:hypothetical protein